MRRRIAIPAVAALALVLATVACGGGDGAGPTRVAPWHAGFDPAAAAARFDAMVASPALRCVLDTIEREDEWIDATELVVDEAPPVVARAFVTAAAARPDRAEDAWHGAAKLAERNALDDARALFALPPATVLVVPFDAARVRVGLEPAPSAYRTAGARTLELVREQALAGDRAGAAQAYDAYATAAPADERDREHRLLALVALERDDEARALLAAAPAGDRWDLRVAWTRLALRSGRGVRAAIDGLITARAARGPDELSDLRLVARVLRFGRGLGHGAAVAPLRRAILADAAAAERPLGPLLGHPLADELAAAGRAEERRRFARALPADARTAAFAALHLGTLDDALAAIAAATEHRLARRAELYARLWARHATQGLASDFDARLATLACAPVR